MTRKWFFSIIFFVAASPLNVAAQNKLQNDATKREADTVKLEPSVVVRFARIKTYQAVLDGIIEQESRADLPSALFNFNGGKASFGRQEAAVTDGVLAFDGTSRWQQQMQWSEVLWRNQMIISGSRDQIDRMRWQQQRMMDEMRWRNQMMIERVRDQTDQARSRQQMLVVRMPDQVRQMQWRNEMMISRLKDKVGQMQWRQQAQLTEFRERFSISRVNNYLRERQSALIELQHDLYKNALGVVGGLPFAAATAKNPIEFFKEKRIEVTRFSLEIVNEHASKWLQTVMNRSGKALDYEGKAYATFKTTMKPMRAWRFSGPGWYPRVW